jgi:DNA-binding response OmpR family regulator
MDTILIVEDDPTMLRGLRDNFQAAGYKVLTATDGETGLSAAVDARPDLVLLDIMLPRINGYEVCRLVREQGLDMPILMLTAKGEESDVVLGLNLGADDYITKPFSIRELKARVAAFLRRRRRETPDQYAFGPFLLDIPARALTRDGEEIPLSPKEFDLLVFFTQRPGRALTRDEILNRVWGHGCFVGPRSIDRCVTTLRNKIEDNPTRPQYLHTIRQIGYKWLPPESDA